MMIKSACLKTLFAGVSALALICVPLPAAARHNGGSHSGGGSHGSGSHGGGSHGGGAFHGGGNSSFKASKKSYSGSRGGSRVTSARMGFSGKSSGRSNVGSYARSGGFSTRSSGNVARGSFSGLSGSGFSGNEKFGAGSGSRNFGAFGTSQLLAQGTRNSASSWRSFGNSSGGRSMLASARTEGGAMGAGWHSFGNLSRGGGPEMSRVAGGNLRTDGQWRSFGSSRNSVAGRQSSGISTFRTSRESPSNFHSAGFGFDPNRISTNMLASTRVSSFSSFSSGRGTAGFGGSRMEFSAFGGSSFGNASFGGLGFSGSFGGSGASLLPNLLGSFLNVGTSIFGSPGLLAANALSLAVRLFVSGLGASGIGQNGAVGGDVGFAPGGFAGNFGVAAFPIRPVCSPAANNWGPAPTLGGYCAPYAYRPFGWGANLYLGDPTIGFSYR
jgi:hypothetical protein